MLSEPDILAGSTITTIVTRKNKSRNSSTINQVILFKSLVEISSFVQIFIPESL